MHGVATKATARQVMTVQGHRSLFLCGQAIREILGGLEYIVKVEPFSHCACAKHNQHANARGSGGMPPRKILKNRCSEIESGGISGSIYYITFRVKLTVK